MCKTNVKINIYYVNICKHEHEKNMIRLWCKIMLKICVELIQGNEGSYLYLYPFGDLAYRSFQGGFYVCIKFISFLKTFLIESQLWINWNLIEN
jgi:hypothetical protein